METVLLVIHLIIALAIIGLVLIQRSSGGGLGFGSGGMGDFAGAKSTANTLTKLTTYFALAFFATSLTLGWMAANRGGENGILDAMEQIPAAVEAAADSAAETTTPATAEEPTVPVAE